MEYQDPYDKAQLLLRYLRHEATPTEQQAVEEWLNENEENRAFFNQLQSEEGLIAETKFFSQTEKEQAWHQLQKAIKPKTRTLWPRIAAAASIILCLSAGGYFLLHKQTPKQQIAQNQLIHNDIAPGGNKAILTSNGRKYVLDSAKNGTISNKGGIAIDKKSDGLISYNAASGNGISTMIYDTLTIPRAGTHKLILSDGSKIWLNAATTIRYPEKFIGNERKVELISGEAYFEVVHNDKMPFRVVSKNQVIEDIGTHFNINAYEDEPFIITTLIEGKVKVTNQQNTVLLKPGQQALLKNGHFKVEDANADMAIAWKNGLFRFENTSLPEVMRQVSRWYNVEISYEGKIPDRTFTGKIHRDVNASEALEILKFTKVNFKIEGKKIIVTP